MHSVKPLILLRYHGKFSISTRYLCFITILSMALMHAPLGENVPVDDQVCRYTTMKCIMPVNRFTIHCANLSTFTHKIMLQWQTKSVSSVFKTSIDHKMTDQFKDHMLRSNSGPKQSVSSIIYSSMYICPTKKKYRKIEKINAECLNTYHCTVHGPLHKEMPLKNLNILGNLWNIPYITTPCTYSSLFSLTVMGKYK